MALTRFVRLELVGGSAVFVPAPTLAQAPIVRAYHEELLTAVRQFESYWISEADVSFFRRYRWCYEAIAGHYPIPAPDRLTSASRHQFFIATAPVPSPADPDAWVPGLSQLEQLMGYQYRSEASANGVEVATTGDPLLDLDAALLVFRPAQAAWLRRTYSPEQLSKLLEYAGKLMQTDEGTSAIQQEQDRALFEQNQAQIDAEFAQQGLMMF